MTADVEWTRERLRNWGAWSRTARAVAVALSAEGRYRPERLAEGEEEDRRTPRAEVDVADALQVWRAVLPTRGFPLGLALVLHGVYARRLRDEALRHWLRRHRMAIRGRDLRNLVHEAEIAAHNRLTRVDGRVKRPYHCASPAD